MELRTIPAFIISELHTQMIVKPWFWMRFFWYCLLDRLHRILFSEIKCFQHHFCKPFSIATLFLVNLTVSDQIHIMNTALVQRVSVLKITLTNIFCSHIFNLCQIVFIDWLSICSKRNVEASKSKFGFQRFSSFLVRNCQWKLLTE